MSFASQTFERIKKMYDDMDEFGPAPLYAVISFLLEAGQTDIAHACLTEAASIHGMEDFIVEGTTRNNDVFLEVFRRVSFAELAPGEDAAQYREIIRFMGEFLTQFAVTLEMNNGKLVLEEVDGDA